MSDQKNKVVVTILNKQYTIIANESVAYILSVADEVNKRIKQISAVNDNLSTEKLIILSALNLCDEYLKMTQTNGALKSQVVQINEELKKTHERLQKIISESNMVKEKLTKQVREHRPEGAVKDFDEGMFDEYNIENAAKEKNSAELEIQKLKKQYAEEIESKLREAFTKTDSVEEIETKIRTAFAKKEKAEELEEAQSKIKELETYIAELNEHNQEIEQKNETLESIKKQYDDEVEKIRRDYAKREQEVLDMIDKL